MTKRKHKRRKHPPKPKPDAADIAFDAVLAANGCEEHIAAVVKYIWADVTGGAHPCPERLFFSERELAMFIADCPAEAKEAAGLRAGRIINAEHAPTLWGLDGKLVFVHKDSSTIQMDDVLKAWTTCEEQHPLTEVVRAYLEAKPQPWHWKTDSNRFMPRSIGKGGALANRESNMGGLPTSIPRIANAELIWPTELFHLAGGNDDRSAFLAARLFLTVVTCADAMCGGLKQRLEILPKDLMKLLYKDTRLHLVLGKMERAADIVHNLRLPVDMGNGEVGKLNVVRAYITPGTPGAPMIFEVDLPAGSSQGPPFSQTYALHAASVSPVFWHTYINTRFMLFQRGNTVYQNNKVQYRDGKVAYQTTQEVKRYGPRLLSADGKRALDAEAGRRLVRIGGYFGEPASSSAHSNHIKNVINALQILEADGHVSLTHGRPMPASIVDNEKSENVKYPENDCEIP